MIKIEFNESCALLLTALGFKLISVPPYWYDSGDAENGPMVDGHNGYDEWTNGTTSVYVVDNKIEGVEATPLEFDDGQD